MMRRNALRLLGVFLAAASPGALAQGAHVHGAGELRVAIEKNRLSIEFRSPLSNLVGFEHAPRTDAQRAAVKSMMSRLNQPDALFRLPKEASCTSAPPRVESPLDQPAPPPKSAKPGPKKDHDDEHAELTATYRFDCADIGKLQSMEVGLFAAFPRTMAIKAEIIGPRGQSSAKLSPKRRVIKL
jgi:hypothetical protein